MENDRILNSLIALEAMGLTLVEKCQQMRKEIAPDPKKKRKKPGLSDEDLLKIEQRRKAVWIRRGNRIEQEEKEGKKPLTKPLTISKKKG
jgi:hypothetical protein